MNMNIQPTHVLQSKMVKIRKIFRCERKNSRKHCRGCTFVAAPSFDLSTVLEGNLETTSQGISLTRGAKFYVKVDIFVSSRDRQV